MKLSYAVPALLLAAAACSERGDAAQTSAAAAAADGPIRYDLEVDHSRIEVEWDYGGMVKDQMTFTGFDGVFELDFDNPENSVVDVTIDMSSLATGIERMEKNLQSEWYFNVENFPTARFVATSFSRTDDTHGVMSGDLTIKDVTLPVSLDVTLNYHGIHPFAEVRDDEKWKTREAAGFTATATVSRYDFGISFIQIIPEFVTVNIDLSLERDTAEAAAE